MCLVRALHTVWQGSVSLFPSLQTRLGCPPATLPHGSGVCQDHSGAAGTSPGLRESKCMSPSSQQGDTWCLRGVRQGLASTSPSAAALASLARGWLEADLGTWLRGTGARMSCLHRAVTIVSELCPVGPHLWDTQTWQRP